MPAPEINRLSLIGFFAALLAPLHSHAEALTAGAGYGGAPAALAADVEALKAGLPRKATALPISEIEIEIDRYLAMPGQSLSYSLGADVILRARARAKAALGDDFDIRAFHDAILKPGMRSLPQVERDVDAWIAAKARQGA